MRRTVKLPDVHDIILIFEDCSWGERKEKKIILIRPSEEETQQNHVATVSEHVSMVSVPQCDHTFVVVYV